MRSLLIKLMAILLAFGMITSIHAGTTGKLVGRVIDATTSEGLAGVNIIIENSSLGAASDVDGNYLIIGVPPGSYSITASFISYKDMVVTEVEINIDKTRRLDFQLQPATLELGSEIVVIADRPLIKRDLTSTEATIGKEMIESLPVENLSEVINLQAGVVDGHFRGGRSGEVLYMINGIPLNDVYSGSYAIEVENNAIQELNIISGTFNAEYGQAMSGVVNVVTREGGSEHEFSLSAYTGSYLTDNDHIFWNETISPIYNLQGTLGGPLPFLKNRISFFASGRYNYDNGSIFGKKVFLPSDHTTDFLMKEIPEERQFISRGQTYQFNEELARKLIDDAETYSMNKSLRYSANLNLSWRASSTDKLNYEIMYQNQAWRQYDHNFRLNPTGDYKYLQWSNNNSLSWNHVFSARSFLDVHAAYLYTTYNQYVYEDPYDPRYVVKERLQDTGANAFASGGQQMWHFDRSTGTYLIKAELTSQFHANHLIKAGVEGKRHRLWMHEFEVIPDQANRLAPLTSFQNNKYVHYPLEAAVFVQDKMEYEDLVINAGLRLDYFDPDGKTPTNFASPDSSAMEKTPGTFQISPRLGLAYPISEKGVIHVSYGHFFQTPNFYFLYTNPEFDIDPLQSSVSPPPQSVKNTVGNSELKPQQTTIYEIGIQQQISDLYGISATVYFKDIRNLLGSEVLVTTEGVRYGRYINRDYGYVRGFTLDFEKRYSMGFAANIDYTYQIARGNASNPNNAYLDAMAGNETVKQVVPLDWDRRHQINAALRIGDPRDFVLSVIARYGTGMPFTQSSRTVQPLVENGGNKPDEFNVDIFLFKKLIWNRMDYSIFIKVYNLFDRLNERDVFSDTGRATYSTEPLYVGGDRPRGLNTLQDYYIHPNFYYTPRRVQIGVEVGF